MPTVLLTGGAGFIGRELIRSLQGTRTDPFSELQFEGKQRETYEVDVLDRDEAILSNARYMSRFRRFIRAGSDISKLGKYDYIIHAGAISDSRCDDLKALMETNYELTRSLIDLRERKGGSMVYVSSASVYGNKPCRERYASFQPQTPYAVSKLLSEKEMAGRHGYCIVRPFNVYGNGEFSKPEHTRSLLYRIAHAAGTGTPMDVFSMDSLRDFVSSVDVAESIVDIMEHHPNDGDMFRGMPFNLGRGRFISVHELCAAAGEESGSMAWLNHVENPYGEAYQSASCAVFDHEDRPYDPETFRDPLKDLRLMVKRFRLGGLS